MHFSTLQTGAVVSSGWYLDSVSILPVPSIFPIPQIHHFQRSFYAYFVAPSIDHVMKEALPNISWGAIFAVVVVGLALQALFGILGIALRASTIDPVKAQRSPTASAFGIGAGIWWVVSSFISMYAAGRVAGHLLGTADKTDTVLHGLAT